MNAVCKQIHLSNFIDDFDKVINTEKPLLLKLFEQYIDINSFMPHEFYQSYYSNTDHPRYYSLASMISAFVFQKFFSFPH